MPERRARLYVISTQLLRSLRKYLASPMAEAETAGSHPMGDALGL